MAAGDSDTGAAGAEGGASDSDRAPLNATAAGSQAAADLSGQQRVEVNLRLDAKEFDDAMAQIAKLGAVRSRAVDTEDVTAPTVETALG